jgi:uncharacterized protein YjbJ (UPF0337 family)
LCVTTGIEGNWKQFEGQAKERWGRLTDDDFDVINGRQEQFEGKIQERYAVPMTNFRPSALADA